MRTSIDRNVIIWCMTVFVSSFSKAKDLHRSSKVVTSLTVVILCVVTYFMVLWLFLFILGPNEGRIPIT